MEWIDGGTSWSGYWRESPLFRYDHRGFLYLKGCYVVLRCFPDPYPDELLYSMCARYSERVRYPNAQAITRDLFGSCGAIATADFPNHLGKLISNLPSESRYTVANFIDNHTSLPFYAPFLPSDRLSYIRQKMQGSQGKAIAMQLGLGGDIPPLSYLRFCPLCVAEDRKQYGECYWHRVHQIPGVEVCPIHNVYLHDSQNKIHNIKYRYSFFTAEKSIDKKLPEASTLSSMPQDILLQIAHDALWLFQHNSISTNSVSVRERYLALLANFNLATYSGKIYASKLQQAFRQQYSDDLLKILHCELDQDQGESWLMRLPRKSEGIQHPIRHFLLIYFLGHTVDTFLSFPSERKPFGTGPWPCLNPTCDHHLERCIEVCEVTYRHDMDGKPRGKFSCTCGYTYTRIGPDISEEDLFRASKAKLFGPIWEATLQTLWADPKISTKQIALRLGVGPFTVKLNAKRLGLPLREQPGKTMLAREIPRRHKLEAVELPEQAVREDYRKKWLSTVEHNPVDGVNELRERIPQIYTWLYGHDIEWLKQHTPNHKKKLPRRRSSYSRIDWKKQDEDLMIKVRDTAMRIGNVSGYPKQITVSTIVNEIGKNYVLSKLDKLPLTTNMLAQFVETDEAFAIHRVQWLSECYRQERICPTRGQFLRRGHFYIPQSRWASVKEAIDEALRMLNTDMI